MWGIKIMHYLKLVYLMTDFAEFHTDATDRTGSVCSFKLHQNHENRRDFWLRSDRFQTTPKSWKTASIIDEIRLQADLINSRVVFHDFGAVCKRSDRNQKSRRFLMVFMPFESADQAGSIGDIRVKFGEILFIR